jgi:hypothetical protein
MHADLHSCPSDGMPRGQRPGQLTRAEIAERLVQHLGLPPEHTALLLDGRAGRHLEPHERAKRKSAAELFSHAVFYRLLTPEEAAASAPSAVTTLPGYLYSHVTDAAHRAALDRYVCMWAFFYTRGARVANRLVDSALRAAAGAGGHEGRPRFALDDAAQFIATAALLGEENFKHCFLYERWPAERRLPALQAYLTALDPGGVPNESADFFSQGVPDWRGLMNPTGWDNAINAMRDKFMANFYVHAAARLRERTAAYLAVIAESDNDAMFADTLTRGLRPLAIDNDVFEHLVALRKVFGAAEPRHWSFKKLSGKNRAVQALHLFLVRHYVDGTSRPYLPVTARARGYAYLDAKILQPLLRSGLDAAGRPVPEAWRTGMALHRLLPLSAADINLRLRELRRRERTRWRKPKATSTRRQGRRQRRRAKKDEVRRRRLRRAAMSRGCGKIDPRAQVFSFETDGVGLRIALTRPLPSTPRPLLSLEAEYRASRVRDAERLAAAAAAAQMALQGPPPAARTATTKPIFVALDPGRAKIFAAAVCQDAWRPPSTFVFTRRRYYAEMHDARRARWEKARSARQPVAAALEALSTGSLRTTDAASWHRYLAADALYRELLEREYVQDKERALWRMVLFRKKRASIDRAVQRLVRQATVDDRTGRRLPMTRPVHFGAGDGSFAPTGPGEQAVPTTEAGRALHRGAERLRRAGRTVVEEDLDESRTTCRCCACGGYTPAARVRDAETGELRLSRRLRSCANCTETTICRRRDRDVQASRNILWVQMHKWHGAPRPSYLSSGHVD